MKKLAVIALSLMAFTANADIIYSAETSGLVFKDKIHVDRFNDPDYPEIACYVNLPDRALDWDEQSDTAMTCVATGPIKGELTSRGNIFASKKGLFFKELRTDRIYDAENHVLVYMSYTKKMDGDNASSAITAVHVPQ